MEGKYRYIEIDSMIQMCFLNIIETFSCIYEPENKDNMFAKYI